MNNQKTGNTLNLALDATSREREASMNLNAGYEKETQRWKLIIRYFGAASELETDEIVVTPLLGNYGIADIPQDQIEGFAQNPAVEYIEAPKRLYFAAYEGRQISCVNPVQNQSPYLFGKGILIACIDSGVDYTHPDFRNEDGSTRILRLWDQSIPGNPPKGYRIGSAGDRSGKWKRKSGNGAWRSAGEQSVGGEAGDPGTEWISQNHRADAGGGLCDPYRTGASDAGGDQSELRKQLWST